MAQTFKFPVAGDLAAKLDFAKRRAAQQGVTIQGDTRAGRFSGMISGSYSISGGIATVTITNKPILAPWSYIESQLRQFLGG